ncbi:hypothetical protein IVB14_24460 [Bradyrhizobium sp. 180]|uniref:hypothetical protein n=1 Tax=unclassified Bradyrhizobium TaxID=2631580 RepID=UPI001FF86614|nr:MULTISPECIES: hypothetical protein [unclassified Bradyrhizobium]MCK1493490.1 hypothetical protein [Bradyrhizobium sp. 180]MCK1754127.1 hypothetical protein [Bradyrhizobium sp. 137]
MNANTWPQWAAAIGVLVEFVGFVVLGLELMQTNKQALREAKLLASEKSLFTTLAVYDDIPGDAPNYTGASVEGGILGRLVESIPAREKEVARSRWMISAGLVVSGLGVLIQIAGAFGQAWLAK